MPRRTQPTARLSPLQPGRRLARRRAGTARIVVAAIALVALAALVIAWPS